MIYQWKLPGMYDVSAQTAGETLQDIYDRKGELQAADVVEESRPETAPLHPCFEWDDPKAAELWREQQARAMIGLIVTVQETAKPEPVEARAFVHVVDSYHPTQLVIQKPEMRDTLLDDALQYVETFKRRLDVFSGLRPIHPLIDATNETAIRLREERRKMDEKMGKPAD